MDADVRKRKVSARCPAAQPRCRLLLTAATTQRESDAPLTAEQERAAAAMLLPSTLPFKLKQTEGRTVKNHKVRAVAREAHQTPVSCGLSRGLLQRERAC